MRRSHSCHIASVSAEQREARRITNSQPNYPKKKTTDYYCFGIIFWVKWQNSGSLSTADRDWNDSNDPIRDIWIRFLTPVMNLQHVKSRGDVFCKTLSVPGWNSSQVWRRYQQMKPALITIIKADLMYLFECVGVLCLCCLARVCVQQLPPSSILPLRSRRVASCRTRVSSQPTVPGSLGNRANTLITEIVTRDNTRGKKVYINQVKKKKRINLSKCLYLTGIITLVYLQTSRQILEFGVVMFHD